MKYLNVTCKVLVMSLVCIIALAQYQSALGDTTYTLSGRVTNQSGIPLTGTTVDVIEPGTGTTIATTSTDLGGLYSLSVNGGTYNVRVTPPIGSELGSAIALGRVITGDSILDFVLVPAGAATLSGRVLNPMGEGVPNQTISIAANGTSNWIYSTTASDGSYSFSVSPGDYNLRLDVSGNAADLGVPRVYILYNRYWDDSILTLNENIIMDIPIPAKRVDVHVQDPLGNPVSGVGLTTSDSGSVTMIGTLPAVGYSYYPNWYPPTVTDESGNITLWLFPTTYTLTVTPPSDSPFAIFNIADTVITNDQSTVIVLQFVHPAPVTSIALLDSPNAANEYPDPTTISLSAAAAEGYTIDATYYRVDGGEQQTYTEPFTVSSGNSHNIEYWSVDNLGVFELPKTLSFNIVINQPPVADAGGPYVVDWGATLTLDGSGSTDPDNNVASYEWDLNNDGLYIDAIGMTITISFNQIGEHIISLRVTDEGGLTDTDTATVTVTDSTPPTVSPTISGTMGNNGWYISDVIVAWTVDDPESGIAFSVGCDTTTLTAETMGDTLTCSATNGAGLSNSASVTIPIDKTAPSITWVGDINDGDSFNFGSVPIEPTCTASDSLSGLDGSCFVSGYAATVGLQSLNATAKDNAGNQSTETRGYTVMPWTLKGFYQPVDMNGVYNIVKNGSTVPLKFEVFAGSTELANIAYIKSLTYAQTSCDATATTDEIETFSTGGTSLRYDAAAGQFIYNWKTPNTAGKCYRVTMTTIDGSSLAAYFKLK